MKKTVFFLILSIAVIVTGKFVFAQEAFFIPQNELQPRYEKLPPIQLPQPKLPSAIRNNEGQAANQQAQQPKIIRIKRRKISHYIAVDGRYIPVFAKEEPQPSPVQETVDNENNLSETATVATEETGNNDSDNVAVITTDFTDEKTPKNNIQEKIASPVKLPELEEEPEPEAQSDDKQMASSPLPIAPQTEETNPDLPSYRNRYTQYVTDLQMFHQSGLFPENKELNQALNKMNSNQEIVVYKN